MADRFCFWNEGEPTVIPNPLRVRAAGGVILQSVNRAMPEYDIYKYVVVGSLTPLAAGKMVTAAQSLDNDTVTTTYTEADDPNYTEEDKAQALADAKVDAVRQIDEAAEAARLAYITGGSGQAMVYQRKAEQAADCLANYSSDNQPETGAYPALDAEVGITGDDVVAVATVVKEMNDAWADVADAIEAIRLKAKRDLADEDVTTSEQVEEILSAIVWPSKDDA